jgi:hypothetical protein
MKGRTIKKLKLFSVDFTHYRLEELVILANHAKPFYDWIEKQFQMELHTLDGLNEIMKVASLANIRAVIRTCMQATGGNNTPKLFDGGGVSYEHHKACYFYFSWMARDAATQRLRPLISKAKKNSGKRVRDIEIEVLANLLFYYKKRLEFFDWAVVREITIQRLEGSRRAKKGSAFETNVRNSLAQAFSYYFQTRGNYGKYRDFDILAKPVKINNRTYDAVVELRRPDGTTQLIIMPVKTRETEGGGHAHLFSRDIEQANGDILKVYPDAIIAFVIVSSNWSSEEIKSLEKKYSHVFHFNCNPNEFGSFGSRQREMNQFIEGVLD